ncbi:YdeI/OmpD-associated family protein [Robiginitalea sediminis]|uniref:YdeI/OmpD-associated family protein n=1 Tax=Robiginitalea sediminis TaxID=1982593 RepID=UPI000B4B729E|nr:YdeI/OmpD-associated family protein [Robiginitalea sediminis]
MDLETLYFSHADPWRGWLEQYHEQRSGVYLIFYKIDHPKPSMRWEEAVQEALCFGWIDSTVKSLGGGKRQQYFCPRKPGSAWSRVNKRYIAKLEQAGRMHPSGLARVQEARQDGSWTALDGVENGDIPPDLLAAFKPYPEALAFFQSLSRTYMKSYLYWLFQAKRQQTRDKRIGEIIACCRAGQKSRNP